MPRNKVTVRGRLGKISMSKGDKTWDVGIHANFDAGLALTPTQARRFFERALAMIQKQEDAANKRIPDCYQCDGYGHYGTNPNNQKRCPTCKGTGKGGR